MVRLARDRVRVHHSAHDLTHDGIRKPMIRRLQHRRMQIDGGLDFEGTDEVTGRLTTSSVRPTNQYPPTSSRQA